MSPEFQLQKAVYGALTTPPITGLGSKVYARVPRSAQLPYAEIGHDLIMGDDEFGLGDTAEFFDATVEVQVFADQLSTLKAITAQVHAALNRTIPMTDGWRVTSFRHERTIFDAEEQNGEQVERAIIQFEYTVQRPE